MTGGSPGTGKGSLTSGAASLTSNERVLRDVQFGLGFGSLIRPADHHQMAIFSSRGPTADGRLDPDNSASGFAVLAQSSDGGVVFVSGTSFSAPNTSGGAALLREAEPGASAADIRRALIESANPSIIEEAGDIDQGHGFVDFPAALAALLDGDDDDDDVRPSDSVRLNIAELGFDTVDFEGDVFSTDIDDLLPGQVAHFFVLSHKDTDLLRITLDNIDPELPPGEQNVLFGDDILLEVVDAPTSVAALRARAFVPAGPATFEVPNPQTGIVRVGVMGTWTNAGPITTDLIIEQVRNPQGEETAEGEVGQGDLDVVGVDIPGGTAEAVFELSWKENWGAYPTDDLDLFLLDPAGVLNFDGATLDSPERVVIDSPGAGIWTIFVQGFTVHDGDDEWELRVTADGLRLDEFEDD